MKLHRHIGILLLLTFSSLTYGQSKLFVEKDKIFNFGFTAGLRSSLPVVNSLTIDGIEAENLQVHYRVGYQGSVFCRLNIDRIFLQPSISWQHSSSEIRFSLPSEIENTQDLFSNRLKLRHESIEVPVLVGYKIIKESPYGLSLMIGPKFKYNYNTKYTFNFENSMNRFSNDSNEIDINIVMGVGVSIWRLFFDFTYEFGLNKMDSDFKNLNPVEASITDITIDKRMNVMSFSLGLLF